MIRSIEIQNFRGIQNGKLEDLTPLTILVGPNGCGKSTILDALLIGARPAHGDAIGHVVQRHQGLRRGARWLFWRGIVESEPRIKVTTYTDQNRVCCLRYRTAPATDAEQATILCSVTVDLSGSFINHGTTETHFKIGNSYTHTGPLARLEDVPNIRLIESRSQDISKPLHELYTETLEQGQLKTAQALIAEIVSGLDNVLLGTEDSTPIIYFDFGEYGLPAALAGDGVQSLLRLCLELASRPGGVVLLEEPEIHEHPGAIHQSARAIIAAVRRGIQVILSTHSLELIDALLSETQNDEELNNVSVFGMKLDDGCLKSYRLNGTEAAFERFQIEDDLR